MSEILEIFTADLTPDANEQKDIELGEALYDCDRSAEDAAADRGLVVVRPKPNQIQLDIDNEEAYVEFKRRLSGWDFAQDHNWFYDIEEHYSASGAPNRHVTLTFWLADFKENGDCVNGAPVEFTEWQRIALQCSLNSDPIREFLNAKRLLWGNGDVCRLFEKPPQEIEEAPGFTR